MVARKPTDKNTKAEILQAYNELAKEQAALKSQLDSAMKEKSSIPTQQPSITTKPAMNQTQSAQQKMNSIIESLAKIQLGFGSAVSELSEQLTTEAAKLQAIRESVGTQIKELKALHNLEVGESTLDNLINIYEENSKNYQQEYTQQSDTLLQTLTEQINSWKKEQEEHQKTIKERDEDLKRTRQRDTAEYKYDLELSRKLNADEYEQQQKALYKQLEELHQATDKSWVEREKALSDREKQFAEAKAKVEAFPQEKEAAIKKATEQGKGIAYNQAKMKADLYHKEVEGQKRFYEQRLQSLEQTIQNQQTRIQNLSQQLESALKQVQDLAVKAIEGASNFNSYNAMKEIALEQAKTQAKAK